MVLRGARRYLPRMSTAKDLAKTDRRIFVTADTHFRHREALAIFSRPHGTVEAMDAEIIAKINETVGPKDILVHLGDFMVAGGKGRVGRGDGWDEDELCRAERLRDAIQCKRIILIRGNHDPSGEKRFDAMFETVEDVVSGRGIAGVDERIVMFHYPIDQWQGRPNGGFHLHGHVHGFGAHLSRRFDVGVDVAVNAMRPRLLVDLIAELRKESPSGFTRA
jgi:calcineurin-like phosphoesterase family protein